MPGAMQITCDDFPVLAERADPGKLFTSNKRDADPYPVDAGGGEARAGSPTLSLFKALVHNPGAEEAGAAR